ncbi:hypothetical protein LINPERHAP2_LOCUS17870 [Linum perenne]
MKIVWGLISRSLELWSKVLVSKYLKRTENGWVLARKKGFSAVWRGLLKVWPMVNNGLRWSIRDGRSTHFWTNRWVDRGADLVDHERNIQNIDNSLLVSQACDEPSVWNFDFLSSVLPRDVVLEVVGMLPPIDRLGAD